MQKAHDLINQSVKSLESTQLSTPEQKPEQRLYRVDGGMFTKDELLWKRLIGLYGYAFTRQYGDDPTPEWMLALNNLAVDQIRCGIERCTTENEFRKFPPNPMQFLTLCLPRGEDMGLPTEAEALRQATGASTQKHPAVSFTLRNMGDDVFALRRADSKTAAAMFGPHWAATIQHVMAGGELPEPELEIEHKHQRADKETGNAILAEMKSL